MGGIRVPTLSEANSENRSRTSTGEARTDKGESRTLGSCDNAAPCLFRQQKLAVSVYRRQMGKAVGRGNWKLVPDRELHRIPKAVIRDIEPYIEARRETIKQFGSIDTAQGGCHTAQGGIGNAQVDFQAPPAPSPAVG